MSRLVIVLLLLAPQVVAQPIDVTIDRDPAVEDYDFSWVYWFETHGQQYLREAVTDRDLPWDTPASRRWRDQVIETLVPMMDDEDDRVRASAVLALARIGHEGLLEFVLPGQGVGVSLLLDRSDDVRLSAWVSLGLLETGEARAALAVDPIEGSGEIDRVGQAVALGLMTKLDRVHGKWLRDRLGDKDESLEVKRWCVWAMSRHDDASLDKVFDAALRQAPSTFIVSEVLSNVPYVQRRGGAGWLIDVLRYHPDVRSWACYRSLTPPKEWELREVPGERSWEVVRTASETPTWSTNGSTPRRLAMETRVSAALAVAQQPMITDGEDQGLLLTQLRRRMVPGNSAQAMDFNRGFDTLAYFMHCGGTQADRDLLYNQLRGFTSLRADDPGVIDKLEEGQESTERDLFARQSDNEVRGYAALSAGLLIRRATEGTGLYEQRRLFVERGIEIERLKRRFGVRLMRAVADEREPVSYRAACALALGLTGDERYKEELAIELGKLKAGDEAVLGYGLLALAMLGEDRVVDPAVRYLTRPGQVLGVGDLLGRRAALRALAVSGEMEGQLAQVWGRNRWVSLYAADTVAWAGRYDAVPAMLNALGNESSEWRQTAATSLGMAFESHWPSRLSTITDGSNPTLSLRPASEELGDAIEAAEQTGPPWPMGRVYALSDPFYVSMKQGVFDLEREPDQDDR